MLYQVIYKYKNKRYYCDVEALHYTEVLNLIHNLTGCEVIEVREYTYIDKNINILNKNLDKSHLIFYLENNKSQRLELQLPLKKKNININTINNYIKTHFKSFDKKVSKILHKQIFNTF